MSHKNTFRPIVKGVLLAFIFGGAAFLFWKNYEYSLSKIKNKQSLWDQTKTLSTEEKKVIYNFAHYLEKNYGLKLRLKITYEHIYIPKLDKRTLFIGLAPSKKEVIVRFPPLLEKAVGLDFIRYLQEKHFQPYFENNNWPEGLISALVLIQKKVEHLG
ncbi:MAG TPA: TPM domain-containing protein [Desulfonauticus sp.]|jgi:hypothetical protein|nr:MAG: Uncharacterized protein XD41_2069 [Desulfonauticus sp. 38_4375]MDK2921263.1 hypothetical protein [Desulfonauticus sp.]HCO12237.1 TPM domain-containing protein [Desulfonauticus sp.]